MLVFLSSDSISDLKLSSSLKLPPVLKSTQPDEISVLVGWGKETDDDFVGVYKTPHDCFVRDDVPMPCSVVNSIWLRFRTSIGETEVHKVTLTVSTNLQASIDIPDFDLRRRSQGAIH